MDLGRLLFFAVYFGFAFFRTFYVPVQYSFKRITIGYREIRVSKSWSELELEGLGNYREFSGPFNPCSYQSNGMSERSICRG